MRADDTIATEPMPARPTGSISAALRTVHNEISSLDEQLSVLCDRLAEILGPQPPEADHVGDEPAVCSDLGGQIAFAASRLRNLSAFVERLTERVDL